MATSAELLKIEQWPLVELLPYANNSREHSPAQIDQIAASIKEFGFINPCLVDAKGVLIAGHGRAAAAQKLGMRRVPVIRLGHLTETQARALRIADNSIALNSTWNEEMLRVELANLKLADYPLELLGFDDAQLVLFAAGSNAQAQAPSQFQQVDENIATEHSCPKCGYRWSGKADAAPSAESVSARK